MTTMATTITTARQPLQDIFILNMQIRRLKYSEKQPFDNSYRFSLQTTISCYVGKYFVKLWL